MKDWQKALVNAAIMGGISFMSMVMASLGQISSNTFIAAGLSAGMTFMSLLCLYFRPPKTDINDEPIVVAKSSDGESLVKKNMPILGVI